MKQIPHQIWNCAADASPWKRQPRLDDSAPSHARTPPPFVFVPTVAVSLKTVTYLSVVVEVGEFVDMFLG